MPRGRSYAYLTWAIVLVSSLTAGFSFYAYYKEHEAAGSLLLLATVLLVWWAERREKWKGTEGKQ